MDPEVQLLASLSSSLRSDYADEDARWEGSPFAWIKTRPSRQVGKIGEVLVERWLVKKGLRVRRPPDTECDLLVEETRLEVKFSTLWRQGNYVFQQFRDQNYVLAVCLGISPLDAHCWVIPKVVLMERVIGHTPQHGGRRGSDTAWLHIKPHQAPPWMMDFGGSLADAYSVLINLLTN